MAPKGYICYRAARAPRLDGTFTDEVWDAAPWTDEFVDIEGDKKPAPRFKTRAKMLWDDRFLYIGAWMEEPQVWATLTEHDSVIFQDNDFEVFIDPDGDNHEYYEIEINAFNTTWDLRLTKPYRDSGKALNEWEVPGMVNAVHVYGTINDPSTLDTGWAVEMAIPWDVLSEFARVPSPPRNGDQWRINFSRVEWDVEVVDGKYKKIPDRKEHNWVWSPQGVIDMHRPEKWGYLQFSTATPGTDALRPDPSLAARDFLMSLYYAQRDFKKRESRFASSLTELNLQLPLSLKEPEIRVEGEGFVAQVSYRDEAARTSRVLRVRDDSRLW